MTTASNSVDAGLHAHYVEFNVELRSRTEDGGRQLTLNPGVDMLLE